MMHPSQRSSKLVVVYRYLCTECSAENDQDVQASPRLWIGASKAAYHFLETLPQYTGSSSILTWARRGTRFLRAATWCSSVATAVKHSCTGDGGEAVRR